MIDGLRLAPHRLAAAYDDLFDPDYYLATYPEVGEAIAAGRPPEPAHPHPHPGRRRFRDPYEVIVSVYYHGRALTHDPGPLSSSSRAGGREGTLLWHYLTTGLPSAIEPIEFFDSRWYLSQNPDLDAAFRHGRVSTPLAHFLRDGSREGRDPGPDFHAAAYLEATPPARDLSGSGGTRGAFGALVRLGGVAGRVTV